MKLYKLNNDILYIVKSPLIILHLPLTVDLGVPTAKAEPVLVTALAACGIRTIILIRERQHLLVDN